MPLGQLLDHAETIIRERSISEELVITAAQSSTRTTNSRMACYSCKATRSENARVEERACVATGATKRDTWLGIVQKTRPGISVDLFLKHLEETLPVSYVYVNGSLRSALLDSGSSQTIVSKVLCSIWRRNRVLVTTINGETRACCGIGTVRIITEAGNYRSGCAGSVREAAGI